MRKIWTLLLTAVLLLSGCSQKPSANEAPSVEKGRYSFYYLQKDYVHSADRSVYNIEKRTMEGDLNTVLREYFLGPKDEDSVSPFPEGTQLQSSILEDSSLKIDLGNDFSALTGIELSIACCALAETCFSCSPASEVQIYAGNALLDGQQYILIRKGFTMLTDEINKEVSDSQ